MPRLWTFGHSTRSSAETVDLLRATGIRRVVDVRSIRGSRHNPQFGAEQIACWLPAADIDYRWIEKLGGRRRKQHVDPTINGGWTHPSFHSYADYTLGAEFEDGLVELARLADSAGPDGLPTAIMCAEAVPWRCHRSLIATVLVTRGWQVDHIIGIGHVTPHVPGTWGAQPVVGADARVTYPPPDPDAG